MQCILTLSPFSKNFFGASRMVGCSIHGTKTTKRLTLMAFFSLYLFLFIYTLFSTVDCGTRTISPEETFHPTINLTLTLTGRQFSSGPIGRTQLTVHRNIKSAENR